MYPFAQTNIQLFAQLSRQGYSETELSCILKAYQLAMSLFTGYFRGDGKTFIAHLVGTASILASVDAPVEVVAAGLLHAAYMQGDFGDGGIGISNSKQEQVRRAVGKDVEKYIAKYTALAWNEESISAIAQNLNTLTPSDRHVLLMLLANELEDHLDLGILYCANFEKRLRYVKRSGDLIVKIAEELGFASLAAELTRVFAEVTSANIPAGLRSTYNYSFQLAPKSYHKRTLIGLRDRLVQSRRFVGYVFRRLKK
ncbi:HD domain-containing protein [Planktothrix sp. FACHB-1355]|uniref:HD domain-containing protein n=1 Tax=Aerosakkonema funiforme FACHB-1375 TaxID=2949571 RepID=A0A926ZEV7_9CYAN|nr:MULTISPECIES: HD domain-containing protein [Oscillatoriales]MBD2180488.1 HD domain-containing protein [Aerosakkonema funiforme FACHB-1375]MBD3560125.1 HD domain-containing protein [Planktothrix sp. FACHB-1355]